MTKAKSKEEWVKAWTAEARTLFGAYQCTAEPDQWERLSKAIKAVIVEIEEIGETMRIEGTWNQAPPE